MKLFSADEEVIITGKYICLGCGNIIELKKGMSFPICDECGAGSPDGPAGYIESIEFWMLID